MAVAVASIIATALAGHNIYAAGEPIKPADAELCRVWLNLILDAWAGDRQTSIADVFTSFTTTPTLQPHTIGPTGTWVLPVRPAQITGAALSLGNGQWQPITVHDDPDWWDVRTPLAGGPITDLYYSADEPNGSIYFDGIPAAASTVRIRTPWAQGAVIATQVINLAPGGELALTLTLQEAIAEPFHVTVSASLERRAGQARGKYFAKNLRNPTLTARGQGLGGHFGARWDYRTGTIR